jgi:hypothetical protein
MVNAMHLEIIVRQIENNNIVNERLIKEIEIKKPESIIDIGFRHSEQIEIIGNIQDSYIPLQCKLLLNNCEVCPKCQGKIRKNGTHTAFFHSSLSDHKLKVQGYSCSCGWQSKPTIHGEFGTNVHPDLVKIQATLGAKMPYKEAEEVIREFNCSNRSVNNHVKVAEATNKVGLILNNLKLAEKIDTVAASRMLYLHVDGGHIKDKDRDKRSFEAMVATVFKPESYRKINEKCSTIEHKHVAASALDDHGETIKRLTLKAAQKEGLTVETVVTSFCDGAANCWSIVDSLQPYCKSITKILDWYHIRQAYDRAMIALPDYHEEIKSSKYKVWHGKVEEGIAKLKGLERVLILNRLSEAKIEKVAAIVTYLSNNISKLVNYMERKTNNLPYTSNVAEATVESQINVRFKRKQKMQWTRENAHNVLQLRTTIYSNEWQKYQQAIDGELIQKVA